MAEPPQDNQQLRPRSVTVALHVVHLGEDDPRKCTAKKLKKFGLVHEHASFKTVPVLSIKLNPFAARVLSAADRPAVSRHGLTVIDCSWNRSSAATFERMHLRNDRRLPVDFFAANPTNYAMPGKLSSVEALAAALIITGFLAEAKLILSKFTWGHTFLELNEQLIDELRAEAGHLEAGSQDEATGDEQATKK